MELVTDALLHKTYYTYTSSGQVDTVTTAYQTENARTTDYDYDDLGRLIKITDPAGVITRNQYDAAGRLTLTIQNVDPSNPDAENPPQNLVSGDDIFNLYTRYYYDVHGNQIVVVDTDWNITRTYYDLTNRPVGVVQNLVINGDKADSDSEVLAAINTDLNAIPSFDPDHSDWNMVTRTEYDDAGNVIVVRDPLGIITRTYYDPANRRQLVVQNWAGGDLYGGYETAPAFEPSYPDRNIRMETFFDANGNAIATVDTHGIVTRTYYDELDRPEIIVQNLVGYQIEDSPPGRNPSNAEYNLRTDIYYDLNGNQIATQDPMGVITRTFYDSLNRPTMVVQNWQGSNVYTDPALDRSQGQCGSESNVCSETFYDQAGNVTLTVDPRGVATHTEYDEANRPTLIVENWGGLPDEIRQTEIAYDEDGRRETVTDLLGRVTRYNYNHAGQLIQETKNDLPGNPSPNFNIITKYKYDPLGRQLTQEDALGRVTMNDYDDLGRLSSVTQNFLEGHGPNYKTVSGDRYNRVTRYAYDIRGSQIAQIAVNDAASDVVTRAYYDALGRPTTVLRNFTGNILDPLPARADPPDRVANVRTDTVYLGNGSVDYVVDELGKITDYGYDPLGRLVSISDPLLNVTNYEYDANGNRTMVIDAEGIFTKYEYDLLNRLITVVENYSITQPANYETNVRTDYMYDAGSNRLSIRDGNSNLDGVDYRTRFAYDPLGRIQSEIDPLGNETLYTYSHDARGNLVSIRDAMLKTTVYHYDELDHLFWIEFPEPDGNFALAADVFYEYDPLGRRTKMTDGLGETLWEYNNLDLPETISAPSSPSISYDYDWQGNRSQISYSDQEVDYKYDALNRLYEVTGGSLPGKVEYEHDAGGRLKSISRPNGVDTAYTYYENGWLQDITHASASTIVASYQYEYYSDGNRRQAIENVLFPTLPPTTTPTPLPTETGTPTPSPTATATESASPTPGETPFPTDTPLPSETATGTETSTSEPSHTPTDTPALTATPSETPGVPETETP